MRVDNNRKVSHTTFYHHVIIVTPPGKALFKVMANSADPDQLVSSEAN